MKTSPIPGKKFGIFAASFCAVLLAFSHHAATLTIGDASTLGYVFLGSPSDDTSRLNYVNHLADMTPGLVDTFSGQTFIRTLNNPGPGFPNYLSAGHPAFNGTGTSIGVGPTAGIFDYLYAKYDGRNQGSVVWFVGDLDGVVTIPASWTGFGLSRWTLFREEGAGHVPDSGSTVVLLGTTLTSLSAVRRYLKR